MGDELKVLIVEDVATDAEIVARQLKRAGIICSTRRVDTAEAFVRQLEEFQPQVILSDFSMPHFDGMQALAIATQSYPDIPFIFVSGTLGEEYAIRALKNGATDYVLKTNLIRLPAAVEKAIQEAQGRQARQALEIGLSESEQRYRELFQSNPHPMWVYDAETLRFLAVNDTAVARYGYSRGEFLSMTVQDIRARQPSFPGLGGDPARALPAMNENSRQHRKKNGAVIDVEIASHDLLFEGRPARMVVAYDITERKQAERRLQESEAKYRELIEQASDGIFVSDAEGNFILVNSRGCELLGYTEQELLGMNGRETYLPEERQMHAQRMSEIRTGESMRFERMVRRKDGTAFPAEISVKKLSNGAVQVIFHDITGRRAQEQKIARLSRIHAVLSGINSVIVRIRDPQKLLNEACRIAVEHGGFRMAWIGLVDRGAKKIVPAAWAGFEDGFLGTGLRLSIEEGVFEGEGTGGRAIRSQAPVVTHDFATDPQIFYKKEHLERGYHSGVIFPLSVGTETVGLLSLYAPETHFFDEEEMKLLSELAGDIAFALGYIEKEETLKYLANYDALTGLPNAALFHDRLTQFVDAALRSASGAAVILINLERFRQINETFGRRGGDALLKMVAQRLGRTLHNPGSLARMVGDTFAVAADGIGRREDDVPKLVDDRILPLLAQPFELDDTQIRVSARAGIALYPDDGRDAETLIRNAEAALKQAKASGQKYLYYTPAMNARVAEKLMLENKLRLAIERNEFVLHYQPKVYLETGRVSGLEALIRWNDPESGLVPPVRFIPLLEETGMILEVGTWAIRQALEDSRLWQAKPVRPPRIAVNVSPLQLQQKDFVDVVRQAVEQNVDGGRELDLEITESLIMQNVEGNVQKLRAIRDMGVNIAVDDFGTGYSSLGYLAKLPVNALKIDRSFVATMTSSTESMTIVSTIISLAHSLGLKVIAEGVETQEQLGLLKSAKCDEAQGYFFSKPIPAEEIKRFIARGPLV